MISKTLNEWQQEVEKCASVYYEKYVISLNDTRCNKVMQENYCTASKNNWELKEVLVHIQKYGSAISPKKCEACRRNDPNHNDKLQRVYNKYQRWINQAITNGFNFHKDRITQEIDTQVLGSKSIEIHIKIIDATQSSLPIAGTERIYDERNKCWRIRSQVLPADIIKEDEFVIVNNARYHKQSMTHRRRQAREAAFPHLRNLNAQNS